MRLLYAWACAEGVYAQIWPYLLKRWNVLGKTCWHPSVKMCWWSRECMQMHLIHLCSLPAVTCCQRLPFPPAQHLSHPALSSSHSSVNNPCCGCSASHTVSTFFCLAQLFWLSKYNSSSPPSTSLCPSPVSPFLGSATVLRREHWVLKPAGAPPEHVCVNISITLRSS